MTVADIDAVRAFAPLSPASLQAAVAGAKLVLAVTDNLALHLAGLLNEAALEKLVRDPEAPVALTTPDMTPESNPT